jgi:PHD/YefM family antitoxin component YafN of YafNO toxin-antitoxin module
METTITANELKVKGVTIIDDIVNENDSAIITVRGKEKYIVLKLEDYNKLREMELDDCNQGKSGRYSRRKISQGWH